MAKATPKRVYMGCTIDPRALGSGLYYALTSQGSVRADTIAGIKRMIRDNEKPQTRKQAR